MSFLSRLAEIFARPGAAPPAAQAARFKLLIAIAEADGLVQGGELAALREAAARALGGEEVAGRLAAEMAGQDLDEIGGELRRGLAPAERKALLAEARALAEADGELGEIEAAMLERIGRLLGLAAVGRPGGG